MKPLMRSGTSIVRKHDDRLGKVVPPPEPSPLRLPWPSRQSAIRELLQMLITGSPSLQLDTLREEITRLHAAGELEASMRAGLNELPEDLRLRAMEKLVTGAWAALLPP